MQFYRENSVKTVIFFRNIFPFIVSISLYAFMHSQYFLNDEKTIGEDYSYFLPYLLNGYYWYLENGLFEIPWFTPGFCGGLPFLPNPQSLYYSIPQFLLLWNEPVQSIYLSFLLFASAGMIAMYFLLCRIFHMQKITAFLGSFIFLFNGFYSSRMIIGHLTYHVFMLLPLISFCLLWRPDHGEYKKIITIIVGIVTPALLLAYTIYAGAANFIVPLLIMLIGVYFCYRLIIGVNTVFWPRFLFSGLLALCLSTAKLLPAYHFIGQFPRDMYLLPGFDGFISAFINVLKTLSGIGNNDMAEQLVNLPFPVSDSGFDFSIGSVPCLIALGYLGYLIYLLIASGQKRESRVSLNKSGNLAILLILCIPALLNSYYPSWNYILKSLPYIESSSLLTRWIAIDIPLLIILICHFLNRFERRKAFYSVVAIVMLSIIFEKSINQERYSEALIYNSDKVSAAYVTARQSRQAQPIEQIGAYIQDNKYVMLYGRNDSIARGISMLNCYEPVFGYLGEQFPMRELQPGPVMQINNNWLNMKKPACYIYPEANNCSPGEHFSVTEITEVENLSHYKPVSFTAPALHLSALWITTLSFLLLLALLLYFVINSVLSLFLNQK